MQISSRWLGSCMRIWRSQNLQKTKVTTQQHLTNTPTPIFIASPKMSTHNDGLNRGTQETQILHL